MGAWQARSGVRPETRAENYDWSLKWPENSKREAACWLLNSDLSRKPALRVSRPNGSLNSSIVNRLNRFEFPRNKPRVVQLESVEECHLHLSFCCKAFSGRGATIGGEIAKKLDIM